MFNFTISTDNVAEAQAIINAINSVNNNTSISSAPINNTQTTTENTSTDTNSSSSNHPITVNQIAEALNTLADMDSDKLEDEFGEGNDKPYRVIKNIGLPAIVRQLGVTGQDYVVGSSYDDVMNAIQYIIKDVSVGGMTHNQMEEAFGVRTSKEIFATESLDSIVDTLKDYDLI